MSLHKEQSSVSTNSKTLIKSALLATLLIGSIINSPASHAGSYDEINRQPGATCQIAAGIMYNEAYKTISGMRLGKLLIDFINPAKRLNPFKQKKTKAYKAVTRLLIAATIVGTVTCPPIVIRAPFIGQPRNFRINRALAEGFSPADPDMIVDVEDPGNPGSCTRTLHQELDVVSGEILDFGDFDEMQFAYAEPFGSYPAVHSLLGDIFEEWVQKLMNAMFGWLPQDILPEVPLDDLNDFIDEMTQIPDNLDVSLGDVPGLLEIFDAMINLTTVEFERQMLSSFNGWLSDVIYLPSDRVEIDYIFGALDKMVFHDGLSEWQVVADNQASPFPGHLAFRFTQRVFVNEYFKPDFDVLYEIEDPNNPGVMLKIVADGEYEALEPGRADRSYTPPTSFQGSLGAHDNCDPDPKEFIQIPTELSLGIHYFPITAIDRANNESDLFHVRINVIDSIPPDVNPPESIGIEVALGTSVVNFTDFGIGCTDYLCQNSLPDRQVFPPTYFDFATITPTYDCLASNTLGVDQPCELASLPVGEATEIRWEASDPSGNVDTIIQHVAIREAGTNQSPVANGTTVTVASGISTAIPLEAADPEFDPLSWQVNSLPGNGQLEVNPDPQFQTRFSFSGTMEKMSSIVKLDGSSGDDSWNRILLADEGNHRLIEVDSIGGSNEPTIYFTHFLGNVKPSSILLYNYDNSSSNIQNEPYLNELLLADWSSGRIHTLLGPNHSPDAGFDISQWVSNPAQMAMLFDGADARLFITEPDPVASTAGKLVVLKISNFNPAATADTWSIAHEATIDMNTELAGFNPASITASSCNMLLLGDTDADGGGSQGRILTYFYLGSNTHGTDRIWDISSLTVDPPGDERPLFGEHIELASNTSNCSDFSAWVADDASKEVIPLELNANTTIADNPAIRAGTEFVTILNLQAPSVNKFFVMTKDRLARYDINGVMNSLMLISDQPENFHNFHDLTPAGDMFIDMDLADNGDVFVLDYGSHSGENTAPGVVRLDIQAGFNQFAIIAGDGLGNSNLTDAYALSFNPGTTPATGDNRVFLAGEVNGLEALDNNLENPQKMLEQNPVGNPCAWCNAPGFNNTLWEQILDLASDEAGNLYFSDSLNRVHKFTSDGSYFGWLGRCDSGVDCDSGNGHSNGFSCKASTCNVATTAGSGQSQLDFNLTNSNLIEFRRPRYGRLTVDDQAGLLYVSDQIDPDNDSNTPRLPRIQSFSLASGAFNSETRPDGEPGNLLSFLDPGDFTDVNDMAVFGDTFFVAEDKPLERLHVFDASAFSAGLNGAFVNYISDPGYAGSDLFEYSVRDSFGADSNIALVDITVVIDNEPPQLSCPVDIMIEGTHPGGAKPSNFIQAEAGSVVLADFLKGYSLSDNVTVPAATAVDNAPVLFPLGNTLVTFTATDGAGNQSTCQAQVSVIDTVVPEMAQPAELVIEASAVLTDFNPPQPAASDQVGPLTVTLSPAGPYPLGVTTLVWAASDGSGNVISRRQNLIVADTTAPLWGLQPPYPDQEAINGYANPIGFNLPGVLEEVELARAVSCMPSPNAAVASVPVEIFCQAMDSSSNFSHLKLEINVIQSDGDQDGITNIIDPTPATADGSGLFSDIPLGGNTAGQIIDDNGFEVSVEDAWFEEQGVRITATLLILEQPTSMNTQFKHGAATGEPAEIDACNGDLHISGLIEGVDVNGDPGPGVAIIACEPYLAIAESGSFNLTLPGPRGELAHVHLSDGNGISFDGTYYTAPIENTSPVIVATPSGSLIIGPGRSVVAVTIFGIPAINIWGMLGLLILLVGVATQELRSRKRLDST